MVALGLAKVRTFSRPREDIRLLYACPAIDHRLDPIWFDFILLSLLYRPHSAWEYLFEPSLFLPVIDESFGIESAKCHGYFLAKVVLRRGCNRLVRNCEKDALDSLFEVLWHSKDLVQNFLGRAIPPDDGFGVGRRIAIHTERCFGGVYPFLFDLPEFFPLFLMLILLLFLYPESGGNPWVSRPFSICNHLRETRSFSFL